MKVDIVRDSFDYVQAAGVLVSLLLAAWALIYAKKSVDEAKGSAEAAEKTAVAAETTAVAATQEAEQTRELLRIAADQHERLVSESSRRPVFAAPEIFLQGTMDPSALSLAQISAMGHQLQLGEQIPLWPVVARATFQNVGDKAADQTLARFLVPSEVGLWRSGPSGEHAEDVDLHADELTLASTDGDSTAHAHAWRIDHLPPRQPEAVHALLVFRQPGKYEVELQAQHQEADAVSRRFVISVPQTGPARIG